jgi:hypothetical protein
VLVAHKEVKYDWKQDFDRNVSRDTIEADVPCYLIYRLDDKTTEGYAWMLISWVPDTGKRVDSLLCFYHRDDVSSHSIFTPCTNLQPPLGKR